LYLFMMAAAASLVSKIEDVNTAIQPLTMVFVISFFVSYFGMMNPGIVLKVASFVPFSSPFAMIARYGVETVPVIEVIISAAILFVSTVLIAKFSIKVYKLGSFNYGTKVNFFKSLFKAIKD
ncbi:MAG: ABC transporter permease, partial [Ezakiella massiliensis]